MDLANKLQKEAKNQIPLHEKMKIDALNKINETLLKIYNEIKDANHVRELNQKRK